MGFKFPKGAGISIKPVNEWGAKEAGTILGAGMGPIGAIIGNQIGGVVDSRRSDAAAKRSAGQNARAAEAAQIAQKYEEERNISRGVLGELANTAVPGVSAAALDPRFRDSQLRLMEQLTARANGQGPSLAQQQFQQAGNTALQKAMGAIRAATGTNAALGGRTAALASTNLLGNVAAESGMARLREQQDAQKMLGDLAAMGRTGDLQSRQQDINLGTSNAELGIKNLLARQQAASEMLGDTRSRFEGHYNRGAQIDASKTGKGGGGDGLLGAILGVGGAVAASMAGAPAAAPAAATAGQAAGSAMSLTAAPQNPKPAPRIGGKGPFYQKVQR